MTAPTITTAQYLAALDALELDPRTTQSATISATVVSVARLATDDDGNVIVELGLPLVEFETIQIEDGAE